MPTVQANGTHTPYSLSWLKRLGKRRKVEAQQQREEEAEDEEAEQQQETDDEEADDAAAAKAARKASEQLQALTQAEKFDDEQALDHRAHLVKHDLQ